MVHDVSPKPTQRVVALYLPRVLIEHPIDPNDMLLSRNILIGLPLIEKDVVIGLVLNDVRGAISNDEVDVRRESSHQWSDCSLLAQGKIDFRGSVEISDEYDVILFCIRRLDGFKSVAQETQFIL